MAPPQVTSHTLCKLLRERHADDIYHQEIYCGSDRIDGGQGRGRFDAWAAVPSWARPSYIGYEIKVSRRDFLQDDKWPIYMDSCNHLYFVAPFGLIDPKEIPEGCGLIQAHKNGKGLRMVKKSPRSKHSESRVFNMLKAAAMRQIIDARKDSDKEAAEKMAAGEWEKIHGNSVAYQITQERKRLEERENKLSVLAERCRVVQEFARQLGVRLDWRAPTTEEMERAWLRKNSDAVPPSLIQAMQNAIDQGRKNSNALESVISRLTEPETES